MLPVGSKLSCSDTQSVRSFRLSSFLSQSLTIGIFLIKDFIRSFIMAIRHSLSAICNLCQPQSSKNSLILNSNSLSSILRHYSKMITRWLGPLYCFYRRKRVCGDMVYLIPLSLSYKLSFLIQKSHIRNYSQSCLRSTAFLV